VCVCCNAVLLSEEVEKIAFNSDYPSILRKHLSCCAHESDLWWNEARVCSHLDYLHIFVLTLARPFCVTHDTHTHTQRTRRFGGLVEKTVRELLEAKEVTLRSSQTRKGGICLARHDTTRHDTHATRAHMYTCTWATQVNLYKASLHRGPRTEL
jgi:ATP-dependent helicase YprA (DUF1998 family)